MALRMKSFTAALLCALFLGAATGHIDAKNLASTSVVTPQGRTVTVTALTPAIIKVENTAAVETTAPSRASVIAEPQSSARITRLSPARTVMTTDSGLVVTIDAASGAVTIDGGAGKVVTDDGVRTAASGKRTLTLATTARGAYYGAGERGHKLNLRGDTLVMYNRQNYGYTADDPRISQMNITMPLFLADDGFAIVFDDYAAAEMQLGPGSEIRYTTESPDPVAFYYVGGANTLASVTTALTSLTGRQPLPPLWSLGYITSKYGYRDERETLGAIDSLKRDGYPVDGIVLDLYWYGKEQDMGSLSWENSQWPDPNAMLKNLKAEGVHLVAISQPFVLRNGRGIDNYNYLAPRGMLMADSTGTSPQEVTIWVGEGGMLDVSNPDTRAWLRDRYRRLTDGGISGWWGDLGEPEVHPESGIHANGLTARQYHNQYGNDWSEIISDLFAEEYPDTRLLTMMRGGTTGLQRYSVFPWSTDVSRSWGGLQPQITIMLNSGLSGLGYMGHDVGGFAVDTDRPVDPELYVRWLQLGLFSPMLRTHAQFNAEPYHYPEYTPLTLGIIKERYAWLPYNYTLAYENARYGYPLVRPLSFDLPGGGYDSVADEYMWGSEVLVAPVMEQGATSRNVILPPGEWVDYSDPRVHLSGDTAFVYDAPIDKIPLFVRAGAFIPRADYKMDNTGGYDPSHLTVQYYPVSGVKRSYTMYDDDRFSPSALADGAYRLIHFNGESHTSSNGSLQGSVTVSVEGTYPGAPATTDIALKIMGIDRPVSVTVAGRKAKSSYDARTSVLTVPLKVGDLPVALQWQ